MSRRHGRGETVMWDCCWLLPPYEFATYLGKAEAEVEWPKSLNFIFPLPEGRKRMNRNSAADLSKKLEFG